MLEVPERMHALGATRASAHLSAAGRGQFAARVQELTPEFRRRLQGTHYGATLEAVAGLFDPSGPLLGAGAGEAGDRGPPPEVEVPLLPPAYFGSPAWHDRVLTTGLATWASDRHAWTLHSKLDAYAFGLEERPSGVVEPAPRFFRALASLARDLTARAESLGAFAPADLRQLVREFLAPVALAPRIGASEAVRALDPTQFALLKRFYDALKSYLGDAPDEPHPTRLLRLEGELEAWLAGQGELSASARSALSRVDGPDVAGKLVAFAALMERLTAIAEKELAGAPLDEGEVSLVRDYGMTIAHLTFHENDSALDPEEQMGLVVAIASNPPRGELLEVGVGAAMELYLVLPLSSGRLALHRGSVYSYYEELRGPIPQTDREWQERIVARSLPAQPAWTGSYLVPPSIESGLPRRTPSTRSCDPVPGWSGRTSRSRPCPSGSPGKPTWRSCGES